jgi:TPR repeat protein
MVKLAQMLASGEDVPADGSRAKTLLETAIAAGGPDVVNAWLRLAGLYANEDSGVGDDAKAIQALRKVVDLGGANAAIWRALGDLYSEGDEPVRNAALAIEAYRNAADAGDPSAMVALALALAPAEFDQAKGLLERAIAAGGPTALDARIALGDLYANAQGDKRNTAAAAEAYRIPADAGNTGAMIELAKIIGWGDGVPVDFEGARRLLERAIARGATSAWSTLAELYLEAGPEHRDVRQAINAYTNAANEGDTGAMIKLARVLGRGDDGVQADFNLAKSWLDKVIATANDPGTLAWAWATLGGLYDDDAPHRDLSAAAAAYQNAADLGETGAMVALAELLAEGDGISVDFNRAEALLRQAIAVNDSNAVEAWAALGDLYRDVDKRPHNLARAADAYKKAVELNSTSAMINLARIVGRGEGVDQDFPLAVDLLNRVIAEDESAAAWAWSTLGGLYRADGPNQDIAKAAEAYGKAADSGDVAAKVALAGILMSQEGSDFVLTRALLESVIAANDGNALRAWIMLGDLYANASPEHADATKAADAYKHAADAGSTTGKIRLARILADQPGGSGFKDAEALLKEVIAVGDENTTWAWSTLGGLYRDAGPDRIDQALAVDAFRHAADGGDTGAMIRLATMIGSGEGVEADFETARSLLIRAIGKKDGTASWAWTTLGDLYRDFEDVEGNATRAVKAYENAVEGGDTGAMIKLARMLVSGNGVERDRVAARNLLEQAAAVGDGNQTWAWSSLGDLFWREEDLASALKYYDLAAAAGDAYASLASAKLDSLARSGTADRLATMLRNYRSAAKEYGVGAVAKEMFQQLNPPSLYYTVQAFLSEVTPSPLRADGVYGARTTQAIAEFCATNSLPCDGTIVTLDLVEALLKTEPLQLAN